METVGQLCFKSRCKGLRRRRKEEGAEAFSLVDSRVMILRLDSKII
jgi:hypothetical protein